MTNPARLFLSTLRHYPGRTAFGVLFVLAILLMQAAQAQTFSVIHYFSGGDDGGFSTAGLTMDRAGRLYGTAAGGGSFAGQYCPDGCGVVFRLVQAPAGWVVEPLYVFQGDDPAKGLSPYAPITFGPDGNLYGTTMSGGNPRCYAGCGTVFRLTPPASACKNALCPWTETVIHTFGSGSDGTAPLYGALLFDAAGNIYGTTTAGGAYNRGTVYELTPSQGGWTETILHSFAGAGDGSSPWSSLIFDQQGNLYGTALSGGDLSCDFSQGCGTVFELSPSGSGWTETTLYTFEMNTDVGFNPEGWLLFDGSGNLYGTVPAGGTHQGSVYELQPSGGSWTASPLAQFMGNGGPVAGLTMDASGNLYGTTAASGAYYHGSVFKLAKQGGTWQLTTLHSFDVEGHEGDELHGGVLRDAHGNLFGTASQGGSGPCVHGCGSIWEITP